MRLLNHKWFIWATELSITTLLYGKATICLGTALNAAPHPCDDRHIDTFRLVRLKVWSLSIRKNECFCFLLSFMKANTCKYAHSSWRSKLQQNESRWICLRAWSQEGRGTSQLSPSPSPQVFIKSSPNETNICKSKLIAWSLAITMNQPSITIIPYYLLVHMWRIVKEVGGIVPINRTCQTDLPLGLAVSRLPGKRSVDKRWWLVARILTEPT